jgi:hypothetical protein
MGQDKSLLPYFWNSESVIDKRLEEDLCVILEKKEKQMAVFFFCWHWDLNSGHTLVWQVLLLLEPLCQPFFSDGFFQDSFLELLIMGWL